MVWTEGKGEKGGGMVSVDESEGWMQLVLGYDVALEESFGHQKALGL